MYIFFFFQAEDGIRDGHVTGVQTCALPICTLDSWLSAADGDASGFWLLSLAGDLLFPRSYAWAEYSAFGLADAQAARAYFSSCRHKRDSILGDPGTDFAWAGGGLTDAWPAAPDAGEYNRVRTT